jgi:DNA-binding HxlR family transcriptional regulator
VKRTDTSAWPCTIARAGAIFGDHWNILLLREALYGTRRFDEFQRALGIGRNVLTDRLRTLTDEGLFVRVAQLVRPDRYDYLLTDKGRDTYPVLLAMATWARAHTLKPGEDPLIFEHSVCGHDFDAVAACSDCGKPLSLDDISVRLGPGHPAYH